MWKHEFIALLNQQLVVKLTLLNVMNHAVLSFFILFSFVYWQLLLLLCLYYKSCFPFNLAACKTLSDKKHLISEERPLATGPNICQALNMCTHSQVIVKEESKSDNHVNMGCTCLHCTDLILDHLDHSLYFYPTYEFLWAVEKLIGTDQWERFLGVLCWRHLLLCYSCRIPVSAAFLLLDGMCLVPKNSGESSVKLWRRQNVERES